MPASFPSRPARSEGRRVAGRWRWCGQGVLLDAVPQAGWPGGPRDAARGGHAQAAAAGEDEPPPRREGLEPVVPAAQAAEVVAVGRALGIRDHVVEVDPGDRLSAAGMAAGAIPGLAEAALRRAGPVPVDRGWPVEDRAATPGGRAVPG